MNQVVLEKIVISASKLIRKDGRLSEFKFSKIKREMIKNLNMANIPQNTELIPVYHKLIKSNKISASPILEGILRKKKIRTLSGIASITVITPDFGCPGKCIYCPTEKGMPKSYLSNEPAVMRAIANKFDPYFQIKTRLDSLKAQGHKTDKIEVIVAGGTWSSIPESFQTWFIANCYAAANNSRYITKAKVKTEALYTRLKKEQVKNEKTKNRIVGLTLETRPDWINEHEIEKMREYGCTRVELGVQNINDRILAKSQRGHTIKETVYATRLLKDSGFKINYHIMLGLPGATQKTDAKMIEEIFTDQNFQPDMLKIYPCVVIENTPLYKLWKEKKYKPFSDKQIVNILKDAKTKIPEYCRVVRVIRDIPTPSIIDGGKVSNLREVIHQEMAKEGKKCRCIRCREVKDFKFKNKDVKLQRIDYPASNGKEIFLSFSDTKNDKLIALLRLRIPAGNLPIFPALKNSALIREVHTYGQAEKIKEKGESQHIGLGKKMMLEAEKIAKKEFGLKNIAVISGVGVRGYYKKLGYKLRDTYLVKNI